MRIAVVILLALGFAAPAAGQNKHAVADLGWMAGCWVIPGDDPASFVTEQWTKPLGMMLAMNRTVREGRVTAFEFLRIAEEAGDIYYMARPSSQSHETPFKLTRLEGTTVLFEKPDHDFPTRIAYTRVADTLTARVENDEGGFSQVFVREECGR